jgi:hypothetical protein
MCAEQFSRYLLSDLCMDKRERERERRSKYMDHFMFLCNKRSSWPMSQSCMRVCICTYVHIDINVDINIYMDIICM